MYKHPLPLFVSMNTSGLASVGKSLFFPIALFVPSRDISYFVRLSVRIERVINDAVHFHLGLRIYDRGTLHNSGG